MFAETKEGICRNQMKRKCKRERKMADAHRARRCIVALAALLQAQEFPAGNPAAAAGSVDKGGDGGNGRKGPEGERDASETAGRFSGKSTWMGGYSAAIRSWGILHVGVCERSTGSHLNKCPIHLPKASIIFCFLKCRRLRNEDQDIKNIRYQKSKKP